MVQNHLSRITAPKSWAISRKATKWTARPLPGMHPIDKCITVNFMLRDLLNYAKTRKEINKILNEGQLLVDKKIRKESKFATGLMDVIDIPKLNENYWVLYNAHGQFYLLPIDKKESNLKLLKVVRKTVVKNGKMQVTFHDGKNLLLDKFDGKIGDTALFDIEKYNVLKWLPFEKDSVVYLAGGKHTGAIGRIKDVIRAKNLEKPKVVVEIHGKEYTTLMEYAFVVGKNHPEIKLEAKQ